MGRRCGGAGADTDRDWDRWWERFVVLVPWVLLVPSAVMVLTQPGRDWTDQATGLGLALFAAGWVLLGHTLATPERRGRPVPATVYFVGLLVSCALLMAHDTLFLVFAITPFFHATVLPTPFSFAGIAMTSIILHSRTMGIPGPGPEPPTLQQVFLFVSVVAIQTVAIGGGFVVAEKSTEQHRERRRMVARLEAALEENAELHAELVGQARRAGVVDERQRMAREIHDTLAQGLTGIVTQIQAAQRSWQSPDTARPHVDRALSLARESLTEARRSVRALRPRQLAQSQLPEALGELSRRWGEQWGLRPDLRITGERVALSPAIEVCLFRVAQESLTNVAKHADASRVGVTLSYLDDVVLLDVRDDGRGMAGGGRDGFGLASMRQRVRGVGGRMEIESEEGGGTAVSVTVPAIPVEEGTA